MLDRMRTRDEGFTMIEVVVALALFGILASTVALALSAILKQTRNNQNRTAAANVAQRVIDRIHAVKFDQIPLGQQPVQQVRTGGNTFSVTVTNSLVPENAGSTTNACDGVGALSSRRVSVEVSWGGAGSSRPVRSETVRRMGVADRKPTLGTVTVQVVDRNNTPASGHVVTLDPGARTFTTGVDGCAVFPDLTPGSYVASMSQVGYVDRVGNPTPSRPVTAVANTVVKDLGFAYDRAATLEASFTVAPPSTLASYPPLPFPNTGVGLGYSALPGGVRGLNACGSEPCAQVLTSTRRRVGSLFPTTEGYRSWAGACVDAKPATLPAAAVLAPGGSASVALPLAPVELKLQTVSGAALTGGTVKITHAVDASCATVSTTLTAPAGSDVVRLSLPGGTFSFQVNSGIAVSAGLTPGGAPLSLPVKSS